MKKFDKKIALYQGIERKYFNSTVKLPINNYYRLYNGVKETLEDLEKLNPEKRTLIEDRYWGEHSWKNWKEYAESINYSVRSAYRLRDEVLAIFAENIGEF